MSDEMRIHFKPPDKGILCGARVTMRPRPNFTYRLKAVNCQKCIKLQKDEWEAKKRKLEQHQI